MSPAKDESIDLGFENVTKNAACQALKFTFGLKLELKKGCITRSSTSAKFSIK